jgi:hypothetical protein
MKTKLFKDRHSDQARTAGAWRNLFNKSKCLDKFGMMWSVYGVIFALALLVAVSCSKDDSPAPVTPPDDEPAAVAVQFSSNIGGIASFVPPGDIKPLAVGGTWTASDAIGVFMVNNGGTTVRNEETNKKYVTSAGGITGNFAAAGSADTVYYPINGDKVDFIAYYPYQSSITSLGDYSVNVATQTDPAGIDLLYAKANNEGAGYDKSNASAVALTFGHQLSKLTMNVSATGSTQITPADLNTMTVTITGLNTQAQFNLATGTLGTASAPAAITPRTATAGSKYEAILLPGAFTGVSVTFAISGGNNPGDYVWNVPDGALEAGKEYVYSISFTGTSGDVDVSGTINPWELGGTPEVGVIAHSGPGVNETLNANESHAFGWATLPNVTAYSIKFAGSANALATAPTSVDVGNNNSFTLSAEILEGFLAAAGVPADGSTAVPVYWTVVPTDPAQYSGVAVQVSMFNAIRQYIPPKSAWTLDWKSSEDASYPAINAIDGNEGTIWTPTWGSVPCTMLIGFGREILIHKITIVAGQEAGIRPTSMAFSKLEVVDETPQYVGFLFPACDGSGRDVFIVDPPVLLDGLMVQVSASADANYTHISEVYVE